jgi:hypothetical protein
VVGFHKHPISRDTDTAIAPGRSRHARLPWCLEPPDLTACACIERKALVRRRDVHDSVYNYRSSLESASVWNGEYPLRRETGNAFFVDLSQRCETIPACFSVVRRPANLRRHFTIPVACTTEKVNALVIGAELQVIEALAEHLTVQHLPADELHFPASDGSLSSLDPTQMSDQVPEFRLGDLGRRHAPRGKAGMDKRDQLLVVAGAETR